MMNINNVHDPMLCTLYLYTYTVHVHVRCSSVTAIVHHVHVAKVLVEEEKKGNPDPTHHTRTVQDSLMHRPHPLKVWSEHKTRERREFCLNF